MVGKIIGIVILSLFVGSLSTMIFSAAKAAERQATIRQELLDSISRAKGNADLRVAVERAKTAYQYSKPAIDLSFLKSLASEGTTYEYHCNDIAGVIKHTTDAEEREAAREAFGLAGCFYNLEQYPGWSN